MSITIYIDPDIFVNISYHTFVSNIIAFTGTTTAQSILNALNTLHTLDPIDTTFSNVLTQTYTPLTTNPLVLTNKQYVVIRTQFASSLSATINPQWGTGVDENGWTYNSSDATYFPDLLHTNIWANLIAYNSNPNGFLYLLFAFVPGFTNIFTLSATNEYNTGFFFTITNVTETSCFLQGTWVQTPKGKKPIESIGKHSYVSNQHGQPVRVLHTTQQTLNYYKHPDLMYKIPKHARGNTTDVFVTKTHPILVNGQRKEARDFGYPLATMEEIADANGDFTVYNLSIEDGNTKHCILVNGHCEMGVGE